MKGEAKPGAAPRLRDWVERIHAMLTRERSSQEPESRLFPAADESQIARLEEELGCELPSSYREFLKTSDGWTGFWFELTLLGTTGAAREAFEEELTRLTDEERESFPESVVLGVNLEDDLFLLYAPDPLRADPPLEVYSLEDGGLETFPSFGRLLETLASGEALPRTLPLDLERSLRLP